MPRPAEGQSWSVRWATLYAHLQPANLMQTIQSLRGWMVFLHVLLRFLRISHYFLIVQ